MTSPVLSPLAVIEDSDEDFEALSRVLRETTVREGIVRYESGEAALAGIPAGARPAMIVLDLNLPGMRGLEVLATLKADPALRIVPIVVLSGSSREEDVEAAYAAGANAYVSKPIDFTELRRAVMAMYEFWRIAALPKRP